MDDRLLNRKETCEALKIDYEQLRYYLARGLPHIGNGKGIIFDLDACHKWFAGGWIKTEKVKGGVLDCSLKKRKPKVISLTT